MDRPEAYVAIRHTPKQAGEVLRADDWNAPHLVEPGAIKQEHIAPGAVTADKIAARAVRPGHIDAVGTPTGLSIIAYDQRLQKFVWTPAPKGLETFKARPTAVVPTQVRPGLVQARVTLRT